MKLHQFALAAALAVAALGSAQAGIYTYTGNFATHDTIGDAPTRIIAHFEFDFENSPSAEYNAYEFKSWDVSYGSIHLSSAAGNGLMNRFTFDTAMNITGWFFNASDTAEPWNYNANIQSLSDNFIFYAPNEAHDIALLENPLRSAAVYGNQGTWTLAPAVPEPATYLMLGAGLAAVGFASRKRRRQAA
ncbi:PEP-CTERM sorting domain-containing protein [Pseudoduganella sp. SL102]|uniref:PEP-CTERM sorting domain-containing protein n=1 Tax=Pseudoduganella sp. SL102 TaxID=2995154 RepID=UPI00248B637E|nr:PEP-CTERM sorting domain-containing protein [Pseudoduganella sp. SL102]WBS05607.1 PEP-CTERM sorting domain-containing protein [Pseudoduganella sp. SL102]